MKNTHTTWSPLTIGLCLSAIMTIGVAAYTVGLDTLQGKTATHSLEFTTESDVFMEKDKLLDESDMDVWSDTIEGLSSTNTDNGIDTYDIEINDSDADSFSNEFEFINAQNSTMSIANEDSLQAKAPKEVESYAAPPTVTDRLETYREDILTTEKRVVELLHAARKQKDVIRLNCVNEKLTQIKGLRTIFEQKMADYYEAKKQGKLEEAAHYKQSAEVAYERIQQLAIEAEQCLGETAVFLGQTKTVIDFSVDDPAAAPAKDTAAPRQPETIEPIEDSSSSVDSW